ncbi:MAG TPA: hypothetical protein PLC15_22945 [Candidatus Obscuribacter sp.]|nr:hypothetical protein [Candidatus Obscuribacter sp.]MBK9277696.1 hypothetical protein [Candidatus Obscuribacter sp.]MBL8084314.1 hypothetical protein [Candidatus Obscuribacter sp.]HMW91702.1 hypothetical protein [Candidatus Obscuribacter sp.]HMX46317.1 hypothetical protein [Candidatus Obscuribacter sp.]
MTFGEIRHLAGKRWAFSLPREHGATVSLSLASFTALVLSSGTSSAVFSDAVLLVSTSLLMLWAMLLSMASSRQLLVVSLISSALLYCLGGLPFALWGAFCGLGLSLFGAVAPVRNSLWWRELFGLTGSVVCPLMFSYLARPDLVLHLIAAGALLASIFSGSALIRLSRKDLGLSPLLPGALSFLCWLILATLSAETAALALLPYVLQSICLLQVDQTEKPSLKVLGKTQAFSLLFVVAVLVLRILA